MRKRITVFFISYMLLLLFMPLMAFAKENDSSVCYIATTACPEEYSAYADDHISEYVLSISDRSFNDIYVGTPFAFADTGADVFYFPVICDGQIEYLFRVYPDGDSFSAAITAFLANDIEDLARYTDENNPMYLNLVDEQIVATIGTDRHVLYEYPEKSSIEDEGTEIVADAVYTAVNAKTPYSIDLNLRQTRDAYKYITLDITEIQKGNEWCTAYCLATIIRTQTNFTTTAKGLMISAVGSNPSNNTTFPWGKIASIARPYGLTPTVLTTTVSNSVLISEINAGRPCIVAMNRGAGQHAVVLRGYSSLGTWGIWNPWYNFYENYSMSGSYVPTGKNAADYSYTPYMHAYNFG